MVDLKAKKDEFYGIIREKLGESKEEFEASYKESSEEAKKTFPNLTGDALETKVIKTLRNKYITKLRSAGKNLVGYVLGYTDAKDTNDYIVKFAPKAVTEGKQAEFEAKNKCRIETDGKTYKLFKTNGKGQEFEIKPRYQRTVYGFCKTPDSTDMLKFICYWQFDSLENAKRPEAVGDQLVKFRGIVSSTQNGDTLVINSVNETEFKATSEKMEVPSFEDLVQKYYEPVEIANIDKHEKKTPISLYGEVRYLPNARYGDKLFIQMNPDDLSLSESSDEIVIQLPTQFAMSQIKGFSPSMPMNCCIFGQYNPYEAEGGKPVRKVDAYGIYVLKSDQVDVEIIAPPEQPVERKTKWG